MTIFSILSCKRFLPVHGASLRVDKFLHQCLHSHYVVNQPGQIKVFAIRKYCNWKLTMYNKFINLIIVSQKLRVASRVARISFEWSKEHMEMKIKRHLPLVRDRCQYSESLQEVFHLSACYHTGIPKRLWQASLLDQKLVHYRNENLEFMQVSLNHQ